jgi:signal transduction histidine kinase
LRQILLNLLSNAIKFTDEGSVTLSAEVDDERVRFRVADTGPGIPSAARERVFEPFTQLDSSNTREKGGTGLGLTVARSLARLLGGDLVIESSDATGSTFVLDMPRTAREP